MAKNPPIYLVCQTIGNQTHAVSQHPTEAQALAALARIEQADPHGTYIAAVGAGPAPRPFGCSGGHSMNAQTIAAIAAHAAPLEAETVLSFALVNNAKDTSTTPKPLPWGDWCARLTCFAIRADKDGPGFIPAVLNGPRKAENLEHYTALALDIEAQGDATPPPPEEAAQRLQAAGLAGVVYTSHNHMAPPELNNGKPAAPRYRVVVPLAQPMPPEHLQANVHGLADRLGLRDCLDPGSSDRGRLFYLPSHREGAPHFAQVVAGDWWQPLAPMETAQPPRPTAAPVGSSTAAAVDAGTLERVKAALTEWKPDDYDEWLKVGMALHSSNHPEAYALWCDWAAQSSKFSAEVSAAKWASFYSERIDAVTVGTIIARANDCPPLSAFRFGGGTFERRTDGLFFVEQDKDGSPRKRYLSPPVEVVAKTRTTGGRGWGRLLRWQDAEGRAHEWAMPLEMLQGDGADMRRTLADRGLSVAVSNAARNLFAAYLQNAPTEKLALCLERTGWAGGLYILPHRVFGEGEELAVYQGPSQHGHPYREAGSVAQWRDNVAALAVGNSRLVFAISAAFAGPLLELAGLEGGGYHFRGGSSSGKSTAVEVAASVWGKPSQYRRQWRNTTNGLEALAVLHNDGFLALDEIRQADPRALPDMVMMLGNGQGKSRMDKHLTARPVALWRLVFLSSGEESLEALTNSAGKTTKAGDEIRLADIPADAGAGYGLWENLHGQPTGGALADLLKQQAETYHGAAGVAWLEHLTQRGDDYRKGIAQQVNQFVQDHTPAGAGRQVGRVCRRFALVAVAGELATQAGLSGWPAGEATKAAARCFADWVASFGGIGNREERTALQQVRAFIEAHGGSRFESMAAGGLLIRERIPNRAGYIRDGEQGREYLIQREQFRREVCKGLDYEAVANALKDAGHLRHEPGRLTGKARHPETAKTESFYIVRASILRGDDDPGEDDEPEDQGLAM